MAIGFYNAAVQALCLLVCAPLIAGIVNKTKATLQKRQGASIFQEYFVYLVTSIMAAMMLPGCSRGISVWARPLSVSIS